MSRFAIGALAALCLISSTLARTQTQTPTKNSLGSLKGTIVNDVTGLPVEGVQVTMIPGQPITEEGVQSLFKGLTPTPQAPQLTKAVPAFTIGGRALTPERTAHSVLTDSLGKFVFIGLAADNYSLSFRANGYNFQVLGQKPDSWMWLPIAIQNNEADAGVIRMRPQSRVTGRVVDLEGHAIRSIPVYLLNGKPSIDLDGQKRFRAVSETLTDSAGNYVFEKIAAGRYLVAAGSFARPALVRFSAGATAADGVRIPAQLPYPFTYYPGVPDAGLAGTVDVPTGIGIEVGDLVMKKQPLMSIQGRVIDYTTGKPPATVRVVLNAWFPFVSAEKPSNQILSVEYDGATGTFEAKDLIPGTYRVDAVLPERQSSARPAGLPFGGVPTQSAFQILELRDADVQDLVLGVPANSRVAGRVIVSDGKPLPVAETNLPIPFQLMLRPLRGMQPAPVVTAVSTQDGTFEVGSGLEGQYRFSIGPLRDNYYVSETRLDGVRITNGILEISKNTISELILTLSPGGEIHGAVVDKQGRAVGQAQGILLPDPLPEIIPFYADIDANAAGQFTASGVPPGNYRIYVWEGIEPFQFFNRELLLRSGTVATRVRVERGSPTSASVQIIVP